MTCKSVLIQADLYKAAFDWYRSSEYADASFGDACAALVSKALAMPATVKASWPRAHIGNEGAHRRSSGGIGGQSICMPDNVWAQVEAHRKAYKAHGLFYLADAFRELLRVGLGLPPPDYAGFKRPRHSPTTLKTKEMIYDLAVQNVSIIEISRQAGVSRQYASKLLLDTHCAIIQHVSNEQGVSVAKLARQVNAPKEYVKRCLLLIPTTLAEAAT